MSRKAALVVYEVVADKTTLMPTSKSPLPPFPKGGTYRGDIRMFLLSNGAEFTDMTAECSSFPKGRNSRQDSKILSLVVKRDVGAFPLFQRGMSESSPFRKGRPRGFSRTQLHPTPPTNERGFETTEIMLAQTKNE